MTGKFRSGTNVGAPSGSKFREVLGPFRSLGFDVTWTGSSRDFNTVLKYALLKPDPTLTEQYGFEYELMVVYHGYSVLESRTIQAVDSLFKRDPAKGRAESMMYFLVSEAPSPDEWVRSYELENETERTAVALGRSDLRHSSKGNPVARVLARHFLSLDRFKNTLPLESDAYFFGRVRELKYLQNAVNRGENAGLFGLRKTGKTSLLYKLERSLNNQRDCLPVFLDAQSTSVRKRSWNQLLEYICTLIRAKVSLRIEEDFNEIDAADSFASYVDRAIKKIGCKRVVLIVDEIEWISPTTAKDSQWKEDYINFWHAVRALQSRKRQVALVIAGVNPSMVEEDSFEGYQNPLFGIVPYEFLRGLSSGECSDMVRKIGKVVGMRFEEDSLNVLFTEYGGHPLLTRLACSYLHEVSKQRGEVFPIRVSANSLRKSAPSRDRELVFYQRHIVSELEKFYPEEYSLLERLAIGDYIGFVEAGKDPTRIAHLYKYGIVEDPDAPYIPYAVLADYVAAENARREGRQAPYLSVPEGERFEFMQLRIRGIVEDFRTLEGLVRRHDGAVLFGPNSFPEADRLFDISPPDDPNGLAAALTPLQRSFVESVDAYGESIGEKQYFFAKVKTAYPHLHRALLRIRAYRNHAQHLHLKDRVRDTVQRFLEDDLAGELVFSEGVYWRLFQRTLDELFRAIQKEITELRS